METGLNAKQFKKFIKREYGERCKEFEWSCHSCRVWRMYDDIESFEDDERVMKKYIKTRKLNK